MTARGRLVVVTAVAVLMVSFTSPAQARPGRVGAPWVTASTPHSMTLTWSAAGGASRYEVTYARTYGNADSASSPSKRSAGRHTSVKVTGLRANTMYCFSVRALRGGSAGSRSATHCHFTMARPNPTGRTTISVATFNVCALARGCHSWASRRTAVLQRIKEADADVVAVQEGARRIRDIEALLKPHGYAISVHSGDDAIFYRTSRLEVATEKKIVEVCRFEPYAGSEDTSTWDPSADHYDEATSTWYQYRYTTAQWVTSRQVCHDEPARVSRYYAIDDAIMAVLRSRRSGRSYAFVGVHLTHGTGAAASGQRDVETRSLLKGAKRSAGSAPMVFMGDFNSDRGRARDTPRIRMAAAGWFDAYDRSSTYTRPQLNSYNGYDRGRRRSVRWGGHIDRIFIRGNMGSSDWAVVARTRHGRYVGTMASDHNPVRTTLHLP